MNLDSSLLMTSNVTYHLKTQNLKLYKQYEKTILQYHLFTSDTCCMKSLVYLIAQTLLKRFKSAKSQSSAFCQIASQQSLFLVPASKACKSLDCTCNHAIMNRSLHSQQFLASSMKSSLKERTKQKSAHTSSNGRNMQQLQSRQTKKCWYIQKFSSVYSN